MIYVIFQLRFLLLLFFSFDRTKRAVCTWEKSVHVRSTVDSHQRYEKIWSSLVGTGRVWQGWIDQGGVANFYGILLYQSQFKISEH